MQLNDLVKLVTPSPTPVQDLPSIPDDSPATNISSFTLSEVRFASESWVGFIDRVSSRAERLLDSGLPVPEDQQQALVQSRIMMRRAKGFEDSSDLIKSGVLDGKVQRLLKRISTLEQSKPVEISFEDLFQGFRPNQLDRIGEGLSNIQLTVGCSVGCPACNFSALAGPRRTLSWDTITEMTDRWGASMKENGAFFYWASDPLDWVDSSGKDYLDLLNYLQEKLKYYPQTTTAIPVGKEELALAIWEGPSQVRFSLSNVNVKRLQKLGIIKGDTIEEIQASLPRSGHEESHIAWDFPKDSILQGRPFNPREGLLYEVGKFYDHETYRMSIACIVGVQVTPDGVFNLASSGTTPITPQGFVRYKLSQTSESFFKYSYRWEKDVNNLVGYEAVTEDGVHHFHDLKSHQKLEGIFEVLVGTLYSTQTLHWSDQSNEGEDRRLTELRYLNGKVGMSPLDFLGEGIQIDRLWRSEHIELAERVWNEFKDVLRNTVGGTDPFNEPYVKVVMGSWENLSRFSQHQRFLRAYLAVGFIRSTFLKLLKTDESVEGTPYSPSDSEAGQDSSTLTEEGKTLGIELADRLQGIMERLSKLMKLYEMAVENERDLAAIKKLEPLSKSLISYMKEDPRVPHMLIGMLSPLVSSPLCNIELTSSDPTEICRVAVWNALSALDRSEKVDYFETRENQFKQAILRGFLDSLS